MWTIPAERMKAKVAHRVPLSSRALEVLAEARSLSGGDGLVFPCPVGAHNSVVGADQGFRAPSWDQESVHDAVHEDSASARIATGQRPRPSFRHPRVS